MKESSYGKKDFCKYGKEFVYRYVKISKEHENVPEIKVRQILEDGEWLSNHPDLSVRFILDKITEHQKDLINNF